MTNEEKVERLLKKMTIAEKVGQMTQYSWFWEATGPAPTEGAAKKKYEQLKNGGIGSVLNVRGVDNVRKMQEVAVKESRLGIPLIFGLDVIHGHKTLFPIPLAESASWDLAAIKQSARVAAIEATAVGINWTFAPMVDISRDARWGRVMEGAGEDPYLGSLIAAARIQGFQGEDLAADNTIASTAKHFAAYGFAEGGRDYNTVDIGTSTLYNIVLPPFKTAVENDVQCFMNAFNVLNGIPATADHFLQRDLLKGKWDFQGFVVSDWGSGAEMIPHGFAKDLKHAAELSIKGGCDMDMESSAYSSHLQELVESGEVSETLLDDAVRRILLVKHKLGLFDDPYKYCDAEREKKLLYHEDHQAAALDMAKKSIVLLKNDEKQLLPLKKDQQKIALIGALANDKTSPLGNWRIGSDDSTAISVLEGLEKYTKAVTYEKGVELITNKPEFIREIAINETDKTGMKEAVALAKESDIVIMVVGEHGFQSGEGRSRTSIGLPGLQQELLEAVHQVNANIVLVLMNGRPLDLTWADENIPAILETWHLGTQSGHAIAQTLFGDNNPSGKLPMSFPRNVAQLPLYYNHLNTGRPGPSEMVFWSHYIDEKHTPLYPFGYGLSYAKFEYDNLNVQPKAKTKDKFEVTVSVKNTGKVAGEEVAQLYIRDRVASVTRPVQELKGFQKVALAAGESKQLIFSLGKKELGFYNNEGTFIVEKGDFDVFVGGNCRDVLRGELVLE